MTNISEMTDSELNEALAIEVMGWHDSGCGWWEDENHNVKFFVSERDKQDDYDVVWQPCTDLNQAVECADYMANLGFSWTVENVENDHYHACVMRPEMKMHDRYTTDTPARALCEAVLSAARGEG